MRVDLFDFELPSELIALEPVEPRDASRLLHVPAEGAFGDKHMRDLPLLLRAGDLLVLNDTRVIAAQLTARRVRGAASAIITLNLHRRLTPSRWAAFGRPAKRVGVGETLDILSADGSVRLRASVLAKTDGEVTLDFNLSGEALDAAIADAGSMPLPPYIASRREGKPSDATNYQTIYAREPGAVAAPTAGLHFTDDLFAALAEQGVDHAFVTLHVGAGTFLPVKSDDTEDHKMHTEWGCVTVDVAEKINRTRAAGGRIVAVGTTSLRLLESAASGDGTLTSFSDETDIFITPGYRFRVVDTLLTNFHLPRSTLFMLVSAIAGRERMLAAYRHAIDANYRFYSYGDACLIGVPQENRVGAT